MRRIAVEFRDFIVCLIKHGGAKFWLAVALTAAIGLLEGGGLLMLMPLLRAIGLAAGDASNRIGRAALAFFHAVHLTPSLPAVLIIFVGIMTLQALLRGYSTVLNSRVVASFTCFLRDRLYQAIIRADWLFFTRQRQSDVTQVLMEELYRVSFGTQQILALLGVVAIGSIQLAIAFALSPLPTTVAMICGGGMLLLFHPFITRAHRLGLMSQAKRSDMAAAVSEHLAGMKIAKSQGREMGHQDRFRRVMEEIFNHWVHASRLNAFARASVQIGAIAALGLYLYCAVAIAHIKTAELLILAFIFLRLLAQIGTLQESWQYALVWLPSFSAAERMRRRFLDAAEPGGADTGASLPLRRAIALEQVGFQYDPERATAALQDIELEIPACQVTAVCGPSGAGKSTLADLLLGLLRPTSGRILLDGEPLEGARIHAWRKSVGYVPQDVFLFHESIRANLLWARPDATEEELRAALRTAAVEEVVDRLPHGLETVIGDRGVRLSGGERQRLALALALLRRPQMLVLDEATSALDTHNERLIQDAITRLHGQMTIILIAHRLSTARMADKIVVLEKGRIAEAGKWEELQGRKDGVFSRLVAAASPP